MPAPKPSAPLVSPKLRNSAKGRPCSLRWALGCADDETVVLAHVRGPWAGVAQKPSDIFGVFACRACHDALDGRGGQRPPSNHILRALVETQSQWLSEGLLSVGGIKR